MAIATKSYNPGFLSDAELREMFCVRVGELESLVETLRENTGSSNQHAIVVGPRGSGKTTLLLRVALEIRSDPELSSCLHPIVFAEESYAVSTCGEFWLECLARLAQQVNGRDGEPDLRRTVEEVGKDQDDRLLRERCLGALLEFADRRGKRLVLLVENLGMVFSDMRDPDAAWCLRKTLQTEPQIMMIGSATSRFDEIDRPDLALYDLFRLLQLRPLDRKESAVLCESVSGRPLKTGTARRLQILTGGSPRLLAIMAQFAAGRSFRTLMADLLDLVDEHTPYFKSHLESLPPQERRVYLALLALWKPATAREVAQRARTDVSKCSAQLKRLIGRGVVTDAGGTSHRKLYRVSERLYNIYYLLRRSRGTDSLVGALIEFMNEYYSPAEFEELVDRMVGEAASANPVIRLIYLVAFEQMCRMPTPAWRLFQKHPEYVPEDVREVTEEVSALLDQGAEKCDSGDFAAALQILDDLLGKFDTHDAATVQDAVVKAWVNKGGILARLERHEEALDAIDEGLKRLASTTSPDLQAVLATAMVNKSACLRALDRIPEAIAVCDELDQHFVRAGSPAAAMAEAGATGMFNRGTMLREVGRTSEEMDAYDALLRRFGSSESVAVLAPVADGQVNKAISLFELRRWEESIEVCDGLVERLGDHASCRLLKPLAKGMIVKSAVLSTQGRIPEQLAVCDDLLSRLDRHDRLAAAGRVTDYSEESVLALRLEAHEVRAYGFVKQGNPSAVVPDIKTVLGILPYLDVIPRRTITCLMVSGLAMGIDQMVGLIRESPSSDLLQALTTARELEMGLQPRVAIEVREVAEDIRRDLERLRKQLGIGPDVDRKADDHVREVSRGTHG